MKRLGLPAIMFHIVALINNLYGKVEHDVAVNECFSGAGHFRTRVNNDNLGAMTYEIADCAETQDVTSARGFVEATLVQRSVALAVALAIVRIA